MHFIWLTDHLIFWRMGFEYGQKKLARLFPCIIQQHSIGKGLVMEGVPEGVDVGLLDGVEVGLPDGVEDGVADGDEVGLLEGVLVGDADGESVGVLDGVALGVPEGVAVGLSEGVGSRPFLDSRGHQQGGMHQAAQQPLRTIVLYLRSTGNEATAGSQLCSQIEGWGMASRLNSLGREMGSAQMERTGSFLKLRDTCEMIFVFA